MRRGHSVIHQQVALIVMVARSGFSSLRFLSLACTCCMGEVDGDNFNGVGLLLQVMLFRMRGAITPGERAAS